MSERCHTLINTFTARDGRLEQLSAFQLAEMRDMSVEASAHGWIGNDVYRSFTTSQLIVVTRFRSPEAQAEWASTERAQRHVRELEPFVEFISSVVVDFLASHGEGKDRA